MNNQIKKLAVIGNPISHSASPGMHNYVLEKLNLPYKYTAELLSVDNFEDDILDFKKSGFSGFNVTIPFKEKILPHLDYVDDDASAIGAVNTVVDKNGKWHGYNTDGIGFIYALKEELNFSCFRKNVVVLGAGGSSRALVYALLKENVNNLVIVNRTIERAENLLNSFSSFLGKSKVTALAFDDSSLQNVLSDSHLVINTTSLGMPPQSDLSALNSFDWCRAGKTVYDIIYKPQETILLKNCALKGANCLNGASMLAAQGMYAFHYFTGQQASYQWFLSKVY